jgi:hypothetical protein
MDLFKKYNENDLEEYFTLEEWSKLSEYEKKRYVRFLENYIVMKELGKLYPGRVLAIKIV